jgi:hypothetical protein
MPGRGGGTSRPKPIIFAHVAVVCYRASYTRAEIIESSCAAFSSGSSLGEREGFGWEGRQGSVCPQTGVYEADES